MEISTFASSFRKARHSVFGGRKLSLRKRIWLVCSGLVCFFVLTTSLSVLQQERTSNISAQLAVKSRSKIILGTEILDTLSEIDQRSRLGESPSWEIGRFHDLVQKYSSDMSESSGAQDLVDRLSFRFQTYVNAITAPKGAHTVTSQALLRSYYQDVVKDVNALVELNANSTFRNLHEINVEQERNSQMALYFLVAFVLLSLIAGYIIITLVTRPLSSLVTFLDRVNVEDDLPTDVPHLRSNVPEIAHVTQSFEQLLQRLRGYRALNVRRLLIEKRRADIIAASISDGIFLLRGDEIIYVNPVAQRILQAQKGDAASYGGMAPVGLNLRALAGVAVAGESEGSDSPRQGNVCARAILTSISQTMPVEMEFEQGDRKAYYLIQAYPISYDLIEQVEHSVKGPLEQILDRFQANTIVVAQDVTLVRESQEAKGHFLATLSHEIKTPVTSLTMATRLLSKMIEEIPNPSHRSLIHTCVEDVDRLRRLLDDLLSVSRFDMIIQKLEFQNIDLIKLLKNSVQSFSPQARQKEIVLTFVSQGVPPECLPLKNLIVPMDPSKVAWAVSNLLTNALRHTPRGGSVEARVICTGDEWVEIRVKDSGPGIEHKRQSRIFDKFSPFYDIRVARSGSAGAGLSIAREIVTAHGGRIWVSSEPGQGAEFGFTLPLKRKQTVPAFIPGNSQKSALQKTATQRNTSEMNASMASFKVHGPVIPVSESLSIGIPSDSGKGLRQDSMISNSKPTVKKGAASGASACS